MGDFIGTIMVVIARDTGSLDYGSNRYVGSFGINSTARKKAPASGTECPNRCLRRRICTPRSSARS